MKLVKIISLGFMISFNIINSADRGIFRVLTRNRQLHNSVKNQFSNDKMKIGNIRGFNFLLKQAQDIKLQRMDAEWAVFGYKTKSYDIYYDNLIKLEEDFYNLIKDLNISEELELLRTIERKIQSHKNDEEVIDQLNLLKKYIHDVKNDKFLSQYIGG